MKCIVPDCNCEKIYARGLCRICYGKAMRLVKAGKTTWEVLVDKGKCKPDSRNKNATNWFLE